MKCYLVPCIIGFIAFDKNLDIVDYELFPRKSIISKLLEFERGSLTSEEEKIMKRLLNNYREISIESKHKRKYGKFKNVKLESPNKAGEYLRENLKETLKKIGFIKDGEFYDSIYKIHMGITVKKLEESLKEQDKLIIQAANALDDLDEATGKFVERIREWYSIYFPELDSIKDHEHYIKLIAEHGKKEDIIKVKKLPRESIGAELEEEDIDLLKEFAKAIRSLQILRKSIEKYIELKMGYLAPNLQDVAGTTLGAKLIAHTGSLKKLALLPSSTIQVLGAEKALFRHLRRGSKPPKHGLIYQHPLIKGSAWYLRGKIARTLASKISLAARKDIFTGEHDPSIKKDLYKRIDIIKKETPKRRR
ncbi:MAG TPA: ATP-binding protein [Methanothermobacter sp.]|nr:pre-mRNA processing ribonucleoprotein, binding domain protein [Methanothermobacter sp. MT-2]HHW04642.1 ATP-binding protein [Methanothermobacter sp.]HOK72107.1 ATP-binding protein [Methanothermobacter sp.]HOL68420.1 ATP-binding protein [Methanothermobacter sp.]HPQ04178.1 ATP-binding protein [Methanothermobacter sp.]